MVRKNPEFCKIENALEVLVGKWKPIILLYLMEHDKMRFGELRRKLPGITQKMLTKQLRELEAEELISRKVYPEVPPKVEYSITEYGKTLNGILEAMHEWGVRHQERMSGKQGK
ncbi:DNA-binding HxlR family transcriptional regulator [Paenibacillus turicensis]|uniref:DNA-binding HxlR family transcriptional regulator n=1 Tax=Paenibacillus turicensis TaxID=160487 RepID=A0ABS4FPZ6_9BACL|nr:helix-turn-helix domain-containing protein [Paenibacillus turicensis]MBP1904659.1 DNA-binding HxlR family transcriptional regulator [Paenibacillus turicensis]